jgi:hypothetical protein
VNLGIGLFLGLRRPPAGGEVPPPPPVADTLATETGDDMTTEDGVVLIAES